MLNNISLCHIFPPSQIDDLNEMSNSYNDTSGDRINLINQFWFPFYATLVYNTRNAL